MTTLNKCGSLDFCTRSDLAAAAEAVVHRTAPHVSSGLTTDLHLQIFSLLLVSALRIFAAKVLFQTFVTKVFAKGVRQQVSLKHHFPTQV